MQDFIILEKAVGETPLSCMEAWRARQSEAYASVPLTYAGRLDPMASGKLLILVGDECKKKEEYLGLDKEYEFEVLLGVTSDTGDVLGLLQTGDTVSVDKATIKHVAKKLSREIDLPYPHFSSKTVNGKPLHVWALEGRLDEITIPTKKSTIHTLQLMHTYELTKDEVYQIARHKIETLPKVTEESKELGNDFRRPLIRKSWDTFNDSKTTPPAFRILKFRCAASSGTYMRTLANVIGTELGTCGLAFSIHRTKIGVYQKLPFGFGYWRKKF